MLVPEPQPEPQVAADRLRAAIRTASRGLVDRSALLELIVLAAVAGEHVLVIGPPGTAKSEAARRISKLLGGRYFEYLLGRFTEPAEIFGPVDLQKLRTGVVETNTTGMLPEAEVAFLDEVFRGSTAILNTLLSILNERKFHGGTKLHEVPLRVCIAASNEIPHDDSLAAFADRFLVQAYVEPVSDSLLEQLLASVDEPAPVVDPAAGPASLADLDALREAAHKVSLVQVRPLLADAVRMLRGEGIELSDRRVVRIQRLLGAAAALDGREQAGPADLWPLVFAIPGADPQQRGRERLRELLAASKSEGLLAAAELASSGPLVRAARLLATGRALLEAAADAGDDPSARLRLEGVAREIDASFHPDQRPPELSQLRAAILDRLTGG
jgi:MoxR-like ATPase